MVKVKIWKITKAGRFLHASAEFSSKEKALEWATRQIAELMKRGHLAGVQVA